MVLNGNKDWEIVEMDGSVSMTRGLASSHADTQLSFC